MCKTLGPDTLMSPDTCLSRRLHTHLSPVNHSLTSLPECPYYGSWGLPSACPCVLHHESHREGSSLISPECPMQP